MRKGKYKLLSIILGVIGVLCIAFFFVSNMMKKTVYTVTFDTTGGSIVANVNVTEGERIEIPSNPVREGYDFKRWEYNNVPYDFSNAVKSNMTLTAIWEKKIVEPTKYTVTFKVGDEFKSSVVTSFSDINIDDLGFEEKKGQIIVWYLDGKEYDMEKPLTKDITLEGKYVKVENFTIKFNSNGGTKVKDQTVKTGGKVEEPKNVVKDNYVLDGWYINSEKYDFNSRVTKSFTLTAKWTEDPNIKWYNINFDSDGGTNVSSQKVKENNTASKPNAPTKKNFIFVDWYKGDKPFDFKTKITEDIDLKAHWREPEKYQVIFQYDDGKEYQKKEVMEGETVEKPANPKKADAEFVEWQLNDKPFVFSTKINKNITLKAKFSDVKKNCIVTFNTGAGATTIGSKTVECGKTITRPADPVKPGYRFLLWQLKGIEFEFSTKITTDIVLDAIYDEKKCQVKFDGNGGTDGATINIPCGTKVTNPPISTREGYRFDGWGLDNDAFDFSTTTINDNVTFKALWTCLDPANDAKPIIYLYPKEKMDIDVKLGHIENVTTIYPKYNDGWRVTAYPDGTLINRDNGRMLYSLYWEGKGYNLNNVNEGFVIKGEDTVNFLEEKLELLGLNEREAEEFIIYWLPLMEHNNYNYIRFATKNEIDSYMPLIVNPKPDTVIRILMEFLPLNKKISVKEQKLEKVERKGFTVVEWGGTLIGSNIVK